jgi:hypothetical protein
MPSENPPTRSAGQLDQIQDRVDARRVHPGGHGLDPQVVAGGPAGVEAGRLEHRADLVQRFGQRTVGAAADVGGARVGAHQAEQDA